MCNYLLMKTKEPPLVGDSFVLQMGCMAICQVYSEGYNLSRYAF